MGLLLAALYQPVWTGAIQGPGDFVVALAAFGSLALWKLPHGWLWYLRPWSPAYGT
ncbi:hypothetical protein ACFLQ0_00760 [Nitrospinota bacterium]